MKYDKLTIAYAIGGLLAIIGVAMRLIEPHYPSMKYVFTPGAALLIAVAFIRNHRAADEPVRIQRLHRLMLIATTFLGVAAFLMFRNDERWVILVLLYALTSVFLAFRSK